MEGPGAPGVPWKRHIVRQLRQRDRTQKALFLELVPACECATGGLEDGSGGDGAPGADGVLSGSSGCHPCAAMPSRLQSFGPAGPSVRYTSAWPAFPRFPVQVLLRAPSWTELPPGAPALLSPQGAASPQAGLPGHGFVSECGCFRVSMLLPFPVRSPGYNPSQFIWSLWPSERIPE